jgi:hypothetical protein
MPALRLVSCMFDPGFLMKSEGSAMKTPDEFAQAMTERERDPSKIAKQRPDDFTSRPVGAIVSAVGLAGLWLYSYVPISDALGNEAEVHYSYLGFVFPPYFFLIGLVWMIFGERAAKVLGPSTSPSSKGKLLYGALLVVSLVYATWMLHYLKSLGHPA